MDIVTKIIINWTLCCTIQGEIWLIISNRPSASCSSDFEITHVITPRNVLHLVQLPLLLYIVLTIIILIGQKPPAYFENSHDFVDKHDYTVIGYPIVCADYTVYPAHCTPLAKEREHLNGFKQYGRLVRLPLCFYKHK